MSRTAVDLLSFMIRYLYRDLDHLDPVRSIFSPSTLEGASLLLQDKAPPGVDIFLLAVNRPFTHRDSCRKPVLDRVVETSEIQHSIQELPGQKTSMSTYSGPANETKTSCCALVSASRAAQGCARDPFIRLSIGNSEDFRRPCRDARPWRSDVGTVHWMVERGLETNTVLQHVLIVNPHSS
nr:hypothetical protein CFP56_25750 [Quercus suber]